MKKTNIKLKGKLRRYLNWPLYLTIVLILMDVAMYAQDIQMGAEFSGFIVLYVIIVLISNRRNRPLLINELVNFATQYGISKSYTSIVLGGTSHDNKLKEISVVPIDNENLIVIVVTDKGHVENKKITFFTRNSTR